MNDITLLNHLNSLAGPQKNSAADKAQTGDNSFALTLQEMVAKTNEAQLDSDRAIDKLNTGEAKNLHEVMINLEQADISLRMMVTMRNKLLEAYKEIMRMQV